MSTIYWGIRIDTTDSNTDTDASIGLYSGYLNWITGRPGYAGSGYSGEAPASQTWKEGLLLDNLSPMMRMTKDMEVSGGYGGLSGFKFKVDDTLGLNNTLESNEYYIVNRPIDVYLFIDDVSYQCWGGVVSDKDKKNVTLNIKCEDDFQNIHKQLPPEILSNTNYPDIDPDNEGKIIPISFGNVLRSKLIAVTGKSEREQMAKLDPDNTAVYGVSAYDIEVSSDKLKLRLKTPYMDFPEHYFRDSGIYYARNIRGGEISMRILDNDVTSSPNTNLGRTNVTIDTFDDIATFNTDHDYNITGGTLTADLWIFEIIKMDVYYIASHGVINEYSLNAKNELSVTIYNKDTDQYDNINELVESTDTSIANNYLHPNVKILNNKLDFSGSMNRLIPVVPEEIEFVEVIGTIGVEPGIVDTLRTDKDTLIDRDRTTYAWWVSNVLQTEVSIIYRVKFPTSQPIAGMNRLYLLFDCDYLALLETEVTTSWSLSHYGPYNEAVFEDLKEDSHEASITHSGVYTPINYLPDEYYKNSGNNNSETNYFNDYDSTNSESYASKFLMNSAIISDFDQVLASPWAYIKMTFTTPGTGYPGIKIKQVGFMVSQNLNTIQDDIFVKMKGETV